jgi:hypothetical protein
VGFNYTWTHFIIFIDVLLALACAASIRSWWRFVRRRLAPSERWYGGQWSDLLQMVGGVVIILVFSAGVLLAVARLEQSLHVESIVTRVDASILRVDPSARDRGPAAPPARPFGVVPPATRLAPAPGLPPVTIAIKQLWPLIEQSSSHRIMVFEEAMDIPAARGVCIVTDRRFLAYEGPAQGGIYTLIDAYDNVTPEEGLRLYHAHAPSTLKPDFNVK